MRTASFTLALVSLLVVAPLALAPACAQQPAPRAPSPEQTLRDLVRVMNAGNEDSLRAFVRDRFVTAGPGMPSAAERVERLGRIRAFLGEVAVRAVDSAGPARASALVQATRTESWRRITVFLDSAGSGRIARVGLAPAADPAAPTRRLSDAEIAGQLRAYVERMAGRDVFSGSVLVARNGKPLYRAAFGEANKDFGVRNAVDTKFNLGSMNKMFTAVSIMQLAEAGKLSLRDTLGKFLPAGTMRPEVLQKVRIEHLLSHTSGLGSYFTPEWDGLSRARFRTVDDWMPLVKDEQLQFEPGTRWSYSNTGMLVLGKVIEKASGEDYFDYVRRHVYAPAGMVNSDAYELDRVNRNLAVGYEREETPRGVEWRNNIFAHVIRGGPAGGGYSTVDDLTRFAAALREGKLVGRESVKLLTTPKPEIGSPDYGYGFQVEENGRIVGHSGGFLGINSQLDIYPGDGYTVAVMSNYGGGAQPIIEKARALILAGRSQTASR